MPETFPGAAEEILRHNGAKTILHRRWGQFRGQFAAISSYPQEADSMISMACLLRIPVENGKFSFEPRRSRHSSQEGCFLWRRPRCPPPTYFPRRVESFPTVSDRLPLSVDCCCAGLHPQTRTDVVVADSDQLVRKPRICEWLAIIYSRL